MENNVSIYEIMEKMNLTNLTEEIDLREIHITQPDLNRLALQLTGFFDHFDSDRIQFIGYVEYAYLKTLSCEEKSAIYERVASSKVPCIVFSRGLQPDDELMACCLKYGVGVLQTNDHTSSFMAELVRWLNVKLAPCISIHGVLVDVYGVGVLIMGESGIGKSEAALELIKRGHRLSPMMW